MKKIFFLSCLLILTNSAFSDSDMLVYKWVFVGQKYEKQSTGNSVLRQTYYGYLVLEFDVDSKRYINQRLVMYWKSNGKKYRKTIDYPAVFSVNIVVPNSNGFTFMKNFSQPEWNDISFEFTSAKKQIAFNKTPDGIDAKNPILIDGILRGHRILDKSDALGNFTLNYGKISATLDNKLTRYFLNLKYLNLIFTIKDVTDRIELMLNQSGYNQWKE